MTNRILLRYQRLSGCHFFLTQKFQRFFKKWVTFYFTGIIFRLSNPNYRSNISQLIIYLYFFSSSSIRFKIVVEQRWQRQIWPKTKIKPKMFSKLTKVTSTLPSLAKQVMRTNQHINHAKWITTSSGKNRSDVLTQNQQQPNDKLKLEQQERWRIRRTER